MEQIAYLHSHSTSNSFNILLQNSFVQHERLIYFIAIKFTQDQFLLHDLVQEGFIGLSKALKRFDPNRGVKFSTFTVPYVKGEMLHFLRDELGFENSDLTKSYNYHSSEDEDNRSFASEPNGFNEEEFFERLNSKLLTEQITKTINQLAEKQKLIVVMHFYEDKSVTEIAKELNVSKAFISKTLSRSLEIMKSLLINYIN